jgi:hypothetical protein
VLLLTWTMSMVIVVSATASQTFSKVNVSNVNVSFELYSS